MTEVHMLTLILLTYGPQSHVIAVCALAVESGIKLLNWNISED